MHIKTQKIKDMFRDSIRDDSKMILDSYIKRAQTISFVERGFERVGLGHRMVVRVGSGQ